MWDPGYFMGWFSADWWSGISLTPPTSLFRLDWFGDDFFPSDWSTNEW